MGWGPLRTAGPRLAKLMCVAFAVVVAVAVVAPDESPGACIAEDGGPSCSSPVPDSPPQHVCEYCDAIGATDVVFLLPIFADSATQSLVGAMAVGAETPAGCPPVRFGAIGYNIDDSQPGAVSIIAPLQDDPAAVYNAILRSNSSSGRDVIPTPLQATRSALDALGPAAEVWAAEAARLEDSQKKSQKRLLHLVLLTAQGSTDVPAEPAAAVTDQSEAETMSRAVVSAADQLQRHNASLLLVLHASSAMEGWFGDVSLDDRYANGAKYNMMGTLRRLKVRRRAARERKARSSYGGGTEGDGVGVGEADNSVKQVHSTNPSLQYILLSRGEAVRVLPRACFEHTESAAAPCLGSAWVPSDSLRMYVPFSARTISGCASRRGVQHRDSLFQFLRNSTHDADYFTTHDEPTRPHSIVSKAQAKVQTLLWTDDIAHQYGNNGSRWVRRLAQAKVPLIIRGSNVLPSQQRTEWTSNEFARVRKALGGDGAELFGVLEANSSSVDTFYFWDTTQPWHNTSKATLPRNAVKNISTSVGELFQSIFGPKDEPGRLKYHLGDLPESLSDTLDLDFLFLSATDRARRSQFMWVSSGGVRTHTHCDMDHNLFVQVHGRKRFWLFPPYEAERLELFPRLHPLWHKAQVWVEAPDIVAQPAAANLAPLEAELSPGDILYIPPYWFHHVLSLTSSVSITSWSLDSRHYERMDGVYRYEGKYLRLKSALARLYSLRMYLDLLVQNMYGQGSTAHFFRALLENRFRHFSGLFPRNATLEEACSRARFPTRSHVLDDTVFDAGVVANLFFEISPEARDLMFINYVEETSAAGLQTSDIVPFFRLCFRPDQGYEFADDDGDFWDEL